MVRGFGGGYNLRYPGKRKFLPDFLVSLYEAQTELRSISYTELYLCFRLMLKSLPVKKQRNRKKNKSQIGNMSKHLDMVKGP